MVVNEIWIKTILREEDSYKKRSISRERRTKQLVRDQLRDLDEIARYHDPQFSLVSGHIHEMSLPGAQKDQIVEALVRSRETGIHRLNNLFAFSSEQRLGAIAYLEADQKRLVDLIGDALLSLPQFNTVLDLMRNNPERPLLLAPFIFDPAMDGLMKPFEPVAASDVERGKSSSAVAATAFSERVLRPRLHFVRDAAVIKTRGAWITPQVARYSRAIEHAEAKSVFNEAAREVLIDLEFLKRISRLLHAHTGLEAIPSSSPRVAHPTSDARRLRGSDRYKLYAGLENKAIDELICLNHALASRVFEETTALGENVKTSGLFSARLETLSDKPASRDFLELLAYESRPHVVEVSNGVSR